MKRSLKIAAWIDGGIVLLGAGEIGWPFLTDVLNPDFEETRIYPDEGRVAPKD